MDTIDLLTKEYLQLQSTLETFDQRALLIKGWSVTVSLVGLAKAIELRNAAMVRLSALAALLFWLIEAMWKGFQQSFEPRIEAIEAAFRNRCSEDTELAKLDPACPDSALAPFQIHAQWFVHWNDTWWYQAPWHMIQPHVFLPHAVVVCIAVYLVRRFDSKQAAG